MAIDDDLDAARAAYPEEPKNLLMAALKVAGAFSVWPALLSALQEVYSLRSERQRVAALLDAFEKVIRRQEKEIGDFSERMKSPEFVETLLKAVRQTSQTTDLNKIGRFARVLGKTLCN